jgi:tetratricopeptide (TPR) repeat protein
MRLTREEATRLLELSREARWTFPSSSGRPVPRGEEAPAWVERLTAEQDSFADAARFFVEEGAADDADEIAANVWRLWIMSRDLEGGRVFLAEVLDHRDAEPSRARALALYGDGLLAFWQGDKEAVRARSEAALQAALAVGDPEALALAHIGLSRAEFDDGDYHSSRDHAVRARELVRPMQPALEQGALHGHAQATRMLGEDDEAAALFAESLALNRRIGDQGMVVVDLHNLGHVEVRRGNLDAAERCFGELPAQGSTDNPYDAAMTDLNQAALAYGRGDNDRASALLTSVRSRLEQSGIEPFKDDKFELDWLAERVA